MSIPKVFLEFDIMSFETKAIDDAKLHYKNLGYKYFSESSDGDIRFFKTNIPTMSTLTKRNGQAWGTPKFLNFEYHYSKIEKLLIEKKYFNFIFLGKGRKFETHVFIKTDTEQGIEDITLDFIAALKLPLDFSTVTYSYCAYFPITGTENDILTKILKIFGRAANINIVEGFSQKPN